MIEDKLDFSKWLIKKTDPWLWNDIKKLCQKLRENNLVDEDFESFLFDLIVIEIDARMTEFFKTPIEDKNDD